MNTRSFSDLRPSPIAGSWYPGDVDVLRQEVEGFFAQADTPAIPGEVLALIVPHAGHIYSGLCAAYAFKTIFGQDFTRVIILSPSHQAYPYPVLTSAHDGYATPLGAVPLDRQAISQISEHLQAATNQEITPVRRDREHAIEIELPFLQIALPKGFDLVPIMLVDQSQHFASVLADAVAVFMQSRPAEEKTLLVASSDLSHFYTENQAKRLDLRVLDALKSMDPASLYRLKASGAGQACGLGAIAAVMSAAKQLGARQLSITDYRTSADVTRDSDSVVGYVSAVISRTV